MPPTRSELLFTLKGIFRANPAEECHAEDLKDFLDGNPSEWTLDVVYDPDFHTITSDQLTALKLTDEWWEVLFSHLCEKYHADEKQLIDGLPHWSTIDDAIDGICWAVGVGGRSVEDKVLEVIDELLPSEIILTGEKRNAGSDTLLENIAGPISYIQDLEFGEVRLIAPSQFAVWDAICETFDITAPAEEFCNWLSVGQVIDWVCSQVTTRDWDAAEATD